MSDTKETKISKELVVKQETSSIGSEVSLKPNGSPSTRTTLMSTQTSNRTITLPDAATTLVGNDTTDTLTSKTISGASNTITNIGNSSLSSGISAAKIGNGDVDNAKLSMLNSVTSNVQTQLNTLTTNTSDIVTSNNTKTLTSKTISGASNTITNIGNSSLSSGIDAAKISSGLVTNTIFDRLQGVTSNIQTQLNAKLDSTNINIVYTDDTQTLTNKTLNNGTIYDDSAINFSLKGTAGSDRRLKFSAENISDFTTRTMTFPDADSTIVSTSATQVLTNKDIDGGTASNTNRITIPKNTLTNLQGLTRKQGTIVFDTTSLKPYYDDGSNLKVIGSGSGTGGNLLQNGDAETGTSSWVTGSFPFDGGLYTPPNGTFTPSAPPSNWTFSTTSLLPISGTNSFQINKVNALTQGRAVTQTISLDPIYRGRVLKARLNYYIIDGSFQYNKIMPSFLMYIGEYNGTTWTYKQPSAFKLNTTDPSGSGRVTQLEGTFQTNIDTTQLMYIIHDTDYDGVHYKIVFEAELLAQEYAYASPINDWQTYTPTVTATTTNPTFGTIAAHSASYRRVGDSAHIRYTFRQTTAGTAGSGTYLFSLPPGLSIDTAKINTNASGTSNPGVLGSAFFGAGVAGEVLYLAGQTNKVSLSAGFNLFNHTTATDNFGAANAAIGFDAVVPIQGWSSSLQVSTDAETRPCFAMYRLASASLTANQPINYATMVVDSHGAVTTGASWKFTAPFADVYEVTAQGATGTLHTLYSVYKNGTLYSEIAYTLGSAGTNHCANGSVLVPMNAGDYVDVRSINTLTSTASIVSGSSLGSTNYVFIRNVRAQQVVAASESVSCSVWLNANAAVAANGIIIYNSKEYDSHGAFNTSTGTFTAPQAAEYEFNGVSLLTTNSNTQVQIWKNGSNYKLLHFVSTVNGIGSGGTKIKLLAGETVTIRSSLAFTFQGTASLAGNTPCTLQINKVGSY